MAPATAGVVGAIEGGGADETAASGRRGDGLGKVGRWGIAVGDFGSGDLKLFEPPAPRRGGSQGEGRRVNFSLGSQTGPRTGRSVARGLAAVLPKCLLCWLWLPLRLV